MRFPQDVPTLTDGVVTLRPHRSDDASAVVEQGSDEEMARWTKVPVPYSREDARWFLQTAVPGGWADEIEFSFAIEVGGRFAGSCSLRDQGERRAELGYALHPASRGRGVMEAAARLLLEWGFTRFDTVVWWAPAGNWASRKVAWRLGFTCEGPLPSWLPHRGSLVDAWVGTLRAGDVRQPQHPWYDAPRIAGPSVVLRPLLHTDAEALVEAFTDEVSRQWLRTPTPYTLEMAHGYVEERSALMAEGRIVYWTVADPTSDELLGAVMLFDIEHGRDAELGYFAHPAARGRRITTEACRLAIRHAFIPEADGGLGLSRVTAYVGVGNLASLRVIEHLGFRRYGVERRGGSNGRGEVFDLACHDLLLEEWTS